MADKKKYWYVVEIVASGQRAIETDLDYMAMQKQVEIGALIAVYRQVVVVQTGPAQMTVMPLDELSHLLKAAMRPHPTMLSGAHVLSFVPVSEESDTWRKVRRETLKETAVVTPTSGGIVLPGQEKRK